MIFETKNLGGGTIGAVVRFDASTSELPTCTEGRATVPFCTAARVLVDDWANEHELPSKLPHICGTSTWWKVRPAIWEALVEAWPSLVVLERERQQHQRLSEIRFIHPPPFFWWAPLIRSVFPEAELHFPRGACERVVPLALLRLRRLLASRLRLRRLRSQPKRSTRVLVLEKDMFWDGGADISLGSIVTALEAAGMEPIIMADFFGTSAQLARSLHTRPNTHMFADLLLPPTVWGAWRATLPPIPVFPPGSFRLRSLDLTRLVTALIVPMIRHLCQSTEIVTAAVQRLIRSVNIDAVIATGEFWIDERVKAGFARAGIPFIAVQNGVIYDDFVPYIYPRGARLNLPTVTCVYGLSVKQRLIEKSVYSSEEITVTGPARFDALARRTSTPPASNITAARLRSRAADANCDRLLLFTSQDGHWTCVHRFLAAMRASSKRYFLLVRLHPREPNDQQWLQLVGSYGLGGRASVRREESLEAMLAACDLHVSVNSTTLIEAAIVGRPSLVVGRSEVGDPNGCVAAGVAAELEAFQSLDAAFTTWVCQREEWERARTSYLAEQFRSLDGAASQRVAQQVVDLLAARRAGPATTPNLRTLTAQCPSD